MQTVLDKLLGMCEADVALLLPALEALSMLCLDDELQAWHSTWLLCFLPCCACDSQGPATPCRMRWWAWLSTGSTLWR